MRLTVGRSASAGKRRDSVNLALDVVERSPLVGSEQKLDLHLGRAFSCVGQHFLDAIDALDRLLHGQHDPLLHLLRARAGVGYDHHDLVEINLGEDLLLDARRKCGETADDENQHDHVGRDAVLGHPR